MKSKIRLGIVVSLLCVLSMLLMYGSYTLMDKEDAPQKESSSEVISTVSKEEPPQIKEPEIRSLSFSMVGDNLIHDNIYKQALARTGGEYYDFTLPYEGVADHFSCMDIAFINQESPIAEDVAPLSGYPRFCSPKAVGDKIADMGFNLIGINNNHMFDKGDEGLLAHMDYWESKDILLCMGAWRTPEDMEKPVLLEKNGITLGFLPMVEHTNGLDAEKGSSIRYIRTDEWDLIEPQLKMINEQSDFQIASIHWGIENSLDTSKEQRELAKRLSDAGIDLIIGNHSHTLQPVEWILREDGTRTLVIYSLGNFISSMLDQQNMLGGIMDLNIEKNMETGETYIRNPHLTPIVTHYDGTGRKDVRIIPLSEYTDELASSHGVKASYPGFSMDYLNGIVKRNIPFEFLTPVPQNP